jgi:uncharacterized iron-regulated membrane protein
VLVSSVSGSAIVFRNEIYTKFSKGPTLVEPVGERLKAAQIEEAARRAYPKNAITFQSQPKNPKQAVEIWLERNGTKHQRLFDPYTGKDLGDAISPVILWTAWLGDLHINLLSKNTGRIVNGVGAILLTLLCLTGAVVWWPGVRSWKRNLAINPRASWKRINWDLHSAIGFWTFGLVFMWAFTGIYVVFPEPFQRAVNYFAPLDYYKLIDEVPSPQVFRRVADDPPPPPRRPRVQRRRSPGDKTLGVLYGAHFGNFGGWPVKALWVLLGLSPALLFVTGVIMWWNRVLSKSVRSSARPVAREAVLSTGS